MQALALQRGLGTCAKLCSVVSAMRCALHLLMFCFNYLCNTTIPKRRETTLPFPAWEARNHWSKIPTAILERSYSQEHWTHLRPTISWNPSLSGTGLPNSFWRALKFLGGIVPVLFAPSHPAPLPSLSAQRRNLTFLGLIQSALVLSPLLFLREWASCVACPGCLYPADTLEEEKDAARCSLMPRLLATHCVRC
jgi:hypothetical protein